MNPDSRENSDAPAPAPDEASAAQASTARVTETDAAATTTARTAARRSGPGLWVIGPAAAVTLLFSLFAIIFPTQAETFFGTIQAAIVDGFSWYYVLITAFFVAFCLFLGFSRYGDIKLGRDDDKPQFSTTAWFSLLFAAGMGIGLVFYGVSEPLSHFVDPKPGVTGTPAQLAQSALTQTYLHWGVQAWAIYVVVGLALAYAIHRRRRPLSIRWALEPVLGRHVRGGWGNAIDAIALVGTLFGVATSLGLGVMQISSGLDSAGIVNDPGLVEQIVIIVVITGGVLFSVLSGVTKGMKCLSTINLVLAALLLGILWFAVLGGSALKLEMDTPGSMTDAAGKVDLQGALFQLFQHLPGTMVLTIGALILIAIFFITSADSGALVMGMLATGGNPEPSRPVRALFTFVTAILAIALLIAGGLVALQTAAIIIALPFSIVMLLICWSTIVAFRRERAAYDRAQRAKFVDEIGERYGLEVEGPNERGIRLPWMRRR